MGAFATLLDYFLWVRVVGQYVGTRTDKFSVWEGVLMKMVIVSSLLTLVVTLVVFVEKAPWIICVLSLPLRWLRKIRNKAMNFVLRRRSDQEFDKVFSESIKEHYSRPELMEWQEFQKRVNEFRTRHGLTAKELVKAAYENIFVAVEFGDIVHSIDLEQESSCLYWINRHVMPSKHTYDRLKRCFGDASWMEWAKTYHLKDETVSERFDDAFVTSDLQRWAEIFVEGLVLDEEEDGLIISVSLLKGKCNDNKDLLIEKVGQFFTETFPRLKTTPKIVIEEFDLFCAE